MRNIPTLIVIFTVTATAATAPPFAGACDAAGKVRSTQARSTRLAGLRVVQAKQTSFEGKDAIEIMFDAASAARLRRFTNDAVGRRVVFFVEQRRLAALRLLDPITAGGVLLTGDFDRLAIEAVLAAGAAIDLELE